MLQIAIKWDGELLFSWEQKSYEEKRVQRTVENRQRCTCPAVDNSTVFHYCGHCQKPCRSRIGCFSHERYCVPRQLIFPCRPSPSTHKGICMYVCSNTSSVSFLGQETSCPSRVLVFFKLICVKRSFHIFRWIVHLGSP